MRNNRWQILPLLVFCFAGPLMAAETPLEIGDRRELFVDDYLISSMKNADLKVHEPVRKNVALHCDKPWEGSGCGYTTVMQDGDLYRMYFHGWQVPLSGSKSHPVNIAYAESKDGINWYRPNLGICEFEGNKNNSLIMTEINGGACHDFTPFIDTRPGVTPDAKYKAIGRGPVPKSNKPRGIWVFKSADAIHWTPMADKAVYTDGAFDTQNIALWSPIEGQYVLYYRVFSEGGYSGFRKVQRAVSDDFIHWKKDTVLEFTEGGPCPEAQYYVNQIKPYYRAPHILIGFPARYVDNGVTASTYQLCDPEERRRRAKTQTRYGSAVTDTVLITSRDGKTFRQSDDVFLRPGLRTTHGWAYGDNYLAYHVVETAPTEDDMPRELSLYGTESYFTGDWSRIRRYTLRIDGFVSVHAKNKQGEMTTKPLVFNGKELSINFRTSAAGMVRAELQGADGKPIPGFTLADSDKIYGDSLDRKVGWKGKTDVSSLAGRPVRIHFTLKEADLYSLKFEK
jgi:hypothetical protein